MEQELIQQFAQSSGRYIRTVMALLQKGELRPGEAMVMEVLAQEQKRPVTPTFLSEVLGVRPPTITPLLNRMEKKGMIRREPYAQDRRVISIVATPYGQSMGEKNRWAGETVYTYLAQQLQLEELREFTRLLKKVVGPQQQKFSQGGECV